MNSNWIIGIALTVALVFPVAVRAHQGHTHKALGMVTSVQGNNLEMKTTDGKVVMIMVDAKTAITRGKVKVDATAVKVGERVSVDYMQQKTVNTAKTIKLGETPAAAKK